MFDAQRQDAGTLKKLLASLTPREREVLILIGQGLSIPKIAERLYRSVKTVESHRLSLGRKLNVSNRVELTRLAIQGGLITLPGQAAADEQEVHKELLGEAASGAPGHIIRALDAATAKTTGEAFFRSLVDQLGPALGARLAYVARMVDEDPDQVEVIAVWCLDQAIEPFRCALTGTFCSVLNDRTVTYVPSGASRQFALSPALRDLGIDCAMGTALHDVHGVRLGSMGVMSDRPLDADREPELILRILAARAGAELERLRSEAALRDSERRYRLLAEHATDFISRHTPEGLYLYASPACRSMLGYDPEDLIGHSAYEFFHPDDVAAVRVSHDRIRDRPVIGRVEFRFRRPDGVYTWLETTSSAIRDPATDRIVEIIAVSRDINARRAAQAELQRAREDLEVRVSERTAALERALAAARESHDRYETLATLSPVGLWRADPQGRCTYVNDRWIEIAGMSHQEALGEGWGRSVDAEDRIRIQGEWQAAVAERRIFQTTGRLRRPDGSAIWIFTIARPEFEPDGRLKGYIGTTADITDLRRSQERLEISERRYRTLIDTTNLGFVVVDRDGRVIEGNAEYVRLTGHRSIEEIRGRPVTEWTAAHDLERNAQEVRKCAESGQVRNLEVDYQWPDGMIMPIDVNATVCMAPEGLQIIALCRDASARRKTCRS